MPYLSAYHLTGVSLTLDMVYFLTALAPELGHGISPLGCLLLQHQAEDGKSERRHFRNQ